MECRHINQIRLLIEAVSRYKNSNIDVVAFSMGSPMARKAILGGICVDIGQYLGQPLTSLVHTFIGVAGANRDAEPLCKLLSWAEPCNQINGISCNSAFLRDINSV
uniref:Triacylglycerol lipase n=1 Tax=Meloidogyne floridensis TaxID=298350 RepID=A0A915NT79_9BILA